MKSISGKRFCKILEANGWIWTRSKGSHRTYEKPGHPLNISVPVHSNEDLKIGILRYLMKLAELNEDDLVNLN